jgi:phospholipase C
MISALKGIQLDDVRHYSLFASDLAQDNYPYTYIFIEPSYDVLNDYRNGASQHPLADVTRGEALIKSTYEAIRNSPLWANSLLIVTWDEHGGFFDHVMPPPARSPGDTDPGAQYNTFGFTFERYGPRVPALVISPRIPKNLIDHRLYDHASIPATLESLFGLSPLTLRDAAANRLDVLCTLGTAREDTPQILPSPATPGTLATIPQGGSSSVDAASVSRPADEVDRGNLPSLVHAALRQDLALQRQATVNRVAAMQNREQARAYIAEVQQKVRQMPQKT